MASPRRKPPSAATLAELERQRDRVRKNIAATEERLMTYRRTHDSLSAVLEYLTP